MKTILVLHNPKAGEEDHQRKELIHAVRSAGYNCVYASIRKQKWRKIKDDIDVLLIVGGDGTVREVVKHVLTRTILDKKLLLSLLPMGTANNIALTLGLPATISELVVGWEIKKTKKIDIGAVKLPAIETFFLEGLGYGILPKLMREMEKLKTDHLVNAEEEIRFALHTMLNLVPVYKAKRGIIEADKKQVQDNFLLIEIMNISSIGPNLTLAPEANVTDGIFEIVYVTESQRDDFVRYIDGLLKRKPIKFPGKIIKGQHIEVKWDGTWIHVDDQLIRQKRKINLKIDVRTQILDFLASVEKN